MTVNELSGKKSTLRAKLKAVCQEERLLKWKEHFMNLLRNPPEVTDKPIQNIINGKLGQFTEEELVTVLKIIKNRKIADLDEIATDV